MIVIMHSTGGDSGRDMLHPAWDGIPFHVVETLQDFTSRLYRDPDAMGLLHAHLADMAGHVVSAIRLGSVKNPLFVTLPVDRDIGRASQQRGRALLMGADDVQPCTIDERELVLRLKVVSKRGAYIDHLNIALPGSTFIRETGRIENQGGQSIGVTPAEAAILVDLARRPGETRSKAQIMDAIYGGADDEPDMKIIDVLVCKLRRKIIEATGGLDVVQTIWGRGYRFVPEGFQPQYRPNRWRSAR